MTITAAADGSALGNPGPAGWAWYVDDERWAAGGWPRGTNNQGELMAVIDLFEATAQLPDNELHVLCDSQYVINAVTKWMPGWKRKGWRKADGAPVLNLELLKRLDAAIAGRRYTFEWVKGHAGHELNEAADERARGAATAYQNRTAVPSGPGWPGAGARRAAAVVPATPPTPASAHVPAPELDIFATSDDSAEASEASATDVPAQAAVEEVVRRERLLLDAAVRADPERVAALLHPRFAEFGASGQVLDHDAAIARFAATLVARQRGDVTLTVLGTERLGPDAVLLTYRSADSSGTALRSSVWLRVDGRWLLRFHQGTREG
jgi:Ribonuclease HI